MRRMGKHSEASIAVLAILLATGPAHAGPPIMETFTYQGRLDQGGVPADGEYDFQFKLFDAYSVGSQVGITQSRSGVDVLKGLFVTGLDWPASVFDGRDLYLQIEVKPHGSADPYTVLSRRQALTGSPYAICAAQSLGLLLPFETTIDSGNTALWVTNEGLGAAGRFYVKNGASNSAALYASTDGAGAALRAYTSGTGEAGYFINALTTSTSDSLYAVTYGLAPAGRFEIIHGSSSAAALHATTNGPSGRGVYARATNTGAYANYGGYFLADGELSRGVYGQSNGASGYGVLGSVSQSGAVGVHGRNTNTTGGAGVHGDSAGDAGMGVHGTATSSGSGVHYGGYFEATGKSAVGAQGSSAGSQGKGLAGVASGFEGTGVYGAATSTSGNIHHGGYFEASGRLGQGVHAEVDGLNAIAVYGEATNDEPGQKVGGYFLAAGEDARGVVGLASRQAGALGTETFGGYFNAASSDGVGVYGWSSQTYFGGAGVRGEIHGAGGAAVQGIANYPCLTAGGFDGNVGVSGDFTCTGTKSFVHPHPRDASKQIAYICLEGGESGVYVRGSGRLEGGAATVILPEHFALVTAAEGITVQVTPQGDCRGLFVAEKTSSRLVIKESQGGTSNVAFDYLVMGVRRGFEGHQPIQENTHVRPSRNLSQSSYERRMAAAENRGLRNLLIENGTLTPEGKVNRSTAERLGWRLGPVTNENRPATTVGGRPAPEE